MTLWQDFLNSGKPLLQPGEQEELEPSCSQAPYLIPLISQSLVRVSGPDAAKFLQGQVTCDLRALDSAETWLAGAQCNLKGRVKANFNLARITPDCLMASLSADLASEFVASLGKYAVFSKVELTDLEDQWVCLALLGESALEVASKVLGVTPMGTPGEFLSGEAFSEVPFALLSHDTNRLELWVQASGFEALWQALEPACIPAAASIWQQDSIRRGIALITQDSTERFLPQELGLTLRGAVSFKKGCYTGQEVVARLHYKGKLKKQLARLRYPTSTPTDISVAIVDESGKSQGQLVEWTSTGPQSFEALAVVTDDRDTALFLAPEGIRAERFDLPYDITQ